MPEIVFMEFTGQPNISLTDDDYLNLDSPPDIPKIPNHNKPLFDRITGVVDRLIGNNIKDLARVPTPFDVNGANIGSQLANRAAALNRLNDEDHSFYDICLLIMDGSPEDNFQGFMDSYNALIEQYAWFLFYHSEAMFSDSPLDKHEFLHEQFRNAKYSANGLIRGTNAALITAYGIAIKKEELPLGPLEKITREGKVPADFVGKIPSPNP